MNDGTCDLAWLDTIEIVGGHPALDFVNTVHSRTEPVLRDYLTTPMRLIAWCRHENLIDAEEARSLSRLPSRHGAALLGAARGLREMLHTLFDGWLNGTLDAKTLALFNREMGKLADWRTLAATASRFEWRYRIDPDHPQSLLAPLAFGAAELLDSPDLARLKACPPPDGCGWLFLDRSRNASRSWCNMKTCGNIAKQRRHRARQLKTPQSEFSTPHVQSN
ncbi:MAG: CGNR zinc finger domain-containing protein [Nitrosospira sp.]|nr:CGNR zinc finger domain-containing protein [Nitrosospira sp.]